MNATKLLCEVFEWSSEGMIGVTTSGSFMPEGTGDICYAPEPGANSDRPREVDRANMALIAETFNVYTETGMTPRELVGQCVELVRTLKDARARLRAMVGPSFDIDPSLQTRHMDELIAKVKVS